VIDNPRLSAQRSSHSTYAGITIPGFEPESPISLAISATLALIPHPNDRDPSGSESIKARRSQAHTFAQCSYAGIEIESELLDSVIDPGEALSSEEILPLRAPFHPLVPVENENIIALLLLSTYEYSQRGNISKMRNRTGQALSAAMNLGLHAKDGEDIYAEANRRTWWMTVRITNKLILLFLTKKVY
jgi:hypothetical protein